MNEKLSVLSPDITRKIREELKSINITDGECIVCKNSKVSADVSKEILKILEKFKADRKIKNEFAKMFCF